HAAWKRPQEFPVLGRRGGVGLGSDERGELSLLALVELTQPICHRFELLHRDVGVKYVIRGQFQKCSGLDHGPHEDLVHSRSVRRSAFANSGRAPSCSATSNMA